MATLAPSLVQLRRELRREFPKRDTRTDGWLGDPAHQARRSEHNPDAKGMVHALDIDTEPGMTEAEKRRLLRELIGDPRVWYVIHEGVIWSSTYGWKARRYTGENPHNGHIHVSIRLAAAAEKDTKAWLKNLKETTVAPAKKAPAKAPAKKAPAKEAAPAKAAEPAKKAPAKKATVKMTEAEHKPGSRELSIGARGSDVALVQRFIGYGLEADGIFGAKTDRAVKMWHKSRGRQVTGTVTMRDWRDILASTKGT